MRCPRYLEGRTQRHRQRLDSARVAQALDHHDAGGIGPRQHLEGDLGQNPQRAVRTCQQLHEVVAGDVLHHPTAVLDDLAASVHEAHADQAVAAGPDLDPARPADICGDHAADGRLSCGPEQPAVIHRLEGQALVALGERGLDLGQRRPRPGHQRQRARLVKADACEPGSRQRRARHRRADRPGAAADDLERAGRVAQDRAQLGFGARCQHRRTPLLLGKKYSGVRGGAPVRGLRPPPRPAPGARP